MSDKGKNFLGGVMLLTLSAAAAKIFGVLYKIPLYAVIGEEGVGYFNSAYVIYTFFYVFTTSGLPVGLSILVAGAGCEREKRAWLRKALLTFGTAGAVCCSLMILFPGAICAAVGNPGAKKCMPVLGPALMFVCLEGAFRGYFQGKKNMMPTAVSQVIEAVCKTGLGLGCAYFATAHGKDSAEAAAWGLFGIAAGGFCSLVYLTISAFIDFHKSAEADGLPSAFQPTAARLLRVVLPVSAASAVMSVSSLIDLSIVMHRLTDVGHTVDEANRIYGVFSGLAQPVFHLPSMLCAPLAAALTPYLSAARSSADKERFDLLKSAALRAAAILSAPFFAVYFLLPEGLLALLFDEASAAKAAPMLAILSFGVCPVALVTVCSAVLQASGRRLLPICAIAAGAAVKTASAYYLIGKTGITGACVGTVLCYLTALCVVMPSVLAGGGKVRPVKTFLLPALCAALCGTAVKIADVFLPIGHKDLKTIAAAAAGGAVYLAALLLCGCADEEFLRAFLPDARVPVILPGRIFKGKTYERKSKRTDQGSLHV